MLGEYFSLVTDVDPEVILTKLHSLLKKTFVTSETKAWIMAAVTKIASHTSCSKTVDELIQELSSSLDTCLRQYAFELKHLCEDKALMKSLLPFDASCTDLVVRHMPCVFFMNFFVVQGMNILVKRCFQNEWYLQFSLDASLLKVSFQKHFFRHMG